MISLVYDVMLECSRSIFEPLCWGWAKNNGSCVRQHLNVQRGIDVIRNTGSVECFVTQYISKIGAIHFWGEKFTFPWNVTNLATLASSDVDVHCDRRVTRVDATCTLSNTFPSDATFASMYFSFRTMYNANTVYVCAPSRLLSSFKTTFAFLFPSNV